MAEIASVLSNHEILLVDDDDPFRSTLARALSRRGMTVYQASCIAEAIEVARMYQPQSAVVDLRMPGESGLELIRLLSEAVAGIRVIVLTGYGSIATAVDAMRLGAVNYLTKPVDAKEVLHALESSTPVTSTGGSMVHESQHAPSLAEVEWEHIQRVLKDCDGNISLAARTLGMHRRSLQRKLLRSR